MSSNCGLAKGIDCIYAEKIVLSGLIKNKPGSGKKSNSSTPTMFYSSFRYK